MLTPIPLDQISMWPGDGSNPTDAVRPFEELDVVPAELRNPGDLQASRPRPDDLHGPW